MNVFLINENIGVARFSSFFSLSITYLFEALFSLFPLVNLLKVGLIFLTAKNDLLQFLVNK